MNDRRRPSKKDVMLELLAKSGVFVYLDPRREGVVVPIGFKKQPELMLQIGLNMAVPIRDLEVDDEAISCTLSFARSPFWCRMPWHAVFGLVSDEDRRGAMWPEDAPRESKLARAGAPEPARPKLRAVGPDERAPEPPAAPARRGDVDGEGICGDCSTKWPEDQESCVLCGASREEAFRGAAQAAEDDGETDGDADAADAADANASKIPLAIRAFQESYDEPPVSTPAPEAPSLQAVPPLEAPPEPAPAPAPEAGEDAEGDASVDAKPKGKKPLPPWLRVVK